MELHPFCKLFPPMGPEAYQELVEDIKERGQLAPIIEFEGMILDGRHRWLACQELGVEPYIEEYEGTDALGYVVSLNLKRRHLDESQRAMIAGRLAEADSRYRANLQMPSRAEAANIMNVGSRSVASAKKVLADGVDELIDAVDRGEVAVSVAAKIAELPKEDQHDVIKADKPEVEIKKVARQKKEKDIAVKTIEESVNSNTQLYNVILTDLPILPWEKIASMKIPAADNSILFMWATSASLCEFLNIMKQWGFEYKSHIVWVKQKPSIGHWTKSWHSLLLIGTKGDILPPPPELQPPSVVQAPIGRHFEKPAIFVETIEKLYPNALKLEMFSRSPREGWSSMGNEIGD